MSRVPSHKTLPSSWRRAITEACAAEPRGVLADMFVVVSLPSVWVKLNWFWLSSAFLIQRRPWLTLHWLLRCDSAHTAGTHMRCGWRVAWFSGYRRDSSWIAYLCLARSWYDHACALWTACDSVRMAWLIVRRLGLLGGRFCVDMNSRLQSSNMMHVGCYAEEEITPSREVDKCVDTNLSIWLTRLYYKSLGVGWYCLLKITIQVFFFFFLFPVRERVRGEW